MVRRREDPIGKVVDEYGPVIGVVGDTKTQNLSGDPEPALYLPFAQTGTAWMTAVVRVNGDLGTAMREARARVAAIDPLLPVTHLGALRDDVDASAGNTRLAMALLSGFALAALALTMLGIYGLVAYTVRARHREIGIRIALGAPSRAVLSLMMRGGILPIVIGVSLGVVLTVAMSGALRKLVFGIAQTDPVTYVSTTVSLIVIAALASWWPARRATRIDPLVAMRTD